MPIGFGRVEEFYEGVGSTGYLFSLGEHLTPVIQRLDLRYTDRDHFVTHLGARPNSTSPTIAGYELLLGARGDLPYAVSTKLIDFTGWNVSTGYVSRSNCRGINCTIPMRTFAPTEIFALGGFHFNFGRGNDHQIQRIAVQPDPYNGRIRVSFGHHSATGPYTAGVQWVSLPHQLFRGPQSGEPGYRHPLRRWRTEGFIGSDTAPRDSHPQDRGLLCGFALNFDNGVQNFQRLQIDLSTRNVSVTYRGNAPGQPASALIEYVNWKLPIA